MPHDILGRLPSITPHTRGRISRSLLAFATVVLVLRLPGSVILMGVCAPASLFIGGIHRHVRPASYLWLFFGMAFMASACAVLVDPTGLSLVNYCTLALIFSFAAAAILLGPNPRRAATAVLSALYFSFGFALLVGLLEMITGFKLQPLLYPEGIDMSSLGRFVVAAWFPNYNDFAVAITMFAVIALTRFIYLPGSARWLRMIRITGYLLTLSTILIGGSRGSLLGILAGSAVVILYSVRQLYPRIINPPALIFGSMFIFVTAVAIWISPWVQDHSTEVRGNILENTISMSPPSGLPFWFGWGDTSRFSDAAATAFPNTLMNPHNVLLELFTWFGLPTLFAFAAVWLRIVWRGLIKQDLFAGWASLASVSLFALTPILGLVPSSSLRYYYLFLIAPCAAAFISAHKDGARLSKGYDDKHLTPAH